MSKGGHVDILQPSAVACDNAAMKDAPTLTARLEAIAAAQPETVAMRIPGKDGRYRSTLTFKQLHQRSDDVAYGLNDFGIKPGMRVVVMVRPTFEFFILMFALFRLGAVPVLVDPGIDKKALKTCLNEAAPDAFIGIPLALLGRKLYGWAKTAKKTVCVGAPKMFADTTFEDLEFHGHNRVLTVEAPKANDVAAILFTSGSTGVPKGVVYRHRHFLAQLDMLREGLDIQAGGVDMPTFPPFALFDPGLGLSAIIPDMDPTRPAAADARKLLSAIQAFDVDQLFGSPALMRVLVEHGKALPGLKRVTSAGAPVPPEVVAGLLKLLPEDARFWTPYGATECLPVALIEGRELLQLRPMTEQGAGTCVGRPVSPNEVRIIHITEDALNTWKQVRVVPQGIVGEITVAGPTVTDTYFNREAQTKIAKIEETLQDNSKRIVHRMGDLGYFDKEGRLWFCGRKTQRVVVSRDLTLCTEQIEPVFNTHPEVARTALVGIGNKGAQVPILCVELAKGTSASAWKRIEDELRHLANGSVLTARVEHFLLYPKPFPVDIRHNAKIGREKLALWAAKHVRISS